MVAIKRRTSDGVVRGHNPNDPPKQVVPRDGWPDVLRDTRGAHTIGPLDNGAFHALWDHIENKARLAEQMLKREKSFSPGFAQAYARTMFACRDAFRDAAAGDPDARYIRANRTAQVEAEAQRLEESTAPPATKPSGKVRKIKRKKAI